MGFVQAVRCVWATHGDGSACGEGPSAPGDCQSGPRSEHTGSEIAVSRVCAVWVIRIHGVFIIHGLTSVAVLKVMSWKGEVVFKS